MSFFYALTGVPPSPDAEPKRSRGRPRKDTSQRVADADTSGAEEVKEKRPRGRPPGGGVKEKTSPQKRVADDEGESSGSEDVVVEKRGRGRPPGSAKKAVRPNPKIGIMASANKAGRPRGRPSGSKNVQDDDNDEDEPLAKDAEYQDAVVRSIVRRPGAGRHGTGASNSHNEDLHREIRELRAKQSELMDLVRDLKAGQNEILGFVRNQ